MGRFKMKTLLNIVCPEFVLGHLEATRNALTLNP